MTWRIARWQGTTKISEFTLEGWVSRNEMIEILERLAREHLEAVKSQPSNQTGEGKVTIRSNRRGTMLWTTDKHDHFTAEKVTNIAHGSPVRLKARG